MKTRLLKRLRRKARKEFPDDMILMLAECKGYFGALKLVNEAIRNHILLRVAELKYTWQKVVRNSKKVFLGNLDNIINI